MNYKNVVGFSLGPVLGAVASAIVIPLLAWLYQAEDIGRYALLLAITNFGVLIFSIGLDQAYVREYHDTENKTTLFVSAILPSLVFYIAFFSLCLFLLWDISLLVYDYTDPLIVLITMITLGLTILNRYFSLPLRMNERGLEFSILQIVQKYSLLVFICLPFFIGYIVDIHTLFFSVLFSQLLCLLVSLYFNRGLILSIRLSHFNVKMTKDMIFYSGYLVLSGCAFSVMMLADKAFLKFYTNLEELAVYAVAVSIAGVATVFQSIFSTMWAPSVYKSVSKSSVIENYDAKLRIVVFVVVFIFCISGLFSFLLQYFLPNKYHDVVYLITSVLSYPLLYSLSEATVVGLGVAKKTGYYALAVIISMCILIALCFLLIPTHGASGAAVSLSISFWFFYFLRTEFSRFFWLKFRRGYMHLVTLLSVVISSLIALYKDDFDLVGHFIWLFFLIFIFTSNYKLLRSVLGKL